MGKNLKPQKQKLQGQNIVHLIKKIKVFCLMKNIILQARLQQYKNQELQMFKLDLEKAEEPEIKLATSVGSQKNKRIPEKHLLLLH